MWDSTGRLSSAVLLDSVRLLLGVVKGCQGSLAGKHAAALPVISSILTFSRSESKVNSCKSSSLSLSRLSGMWGLSRLTYRLGLAGSRAHWARLYLLLPCLLPTLRPADTSVLVLFHQWTSMGQVIWAFSSSSSSLGALGRDLGGWVLSGTVLPYC